MDSGDAPHSLHVREFVVEFIEDTLKGGNDCFRPRAIVRRSECSAPCRVRLYIGLLAEPSRPKIESYQGDSSPYGALWISRMTGPREAG